MIPLSKKVKVVLFSGGRGSSVLSQGLIANPRVQLTLAVNGYDDGASTGEVRRLLGDGLGPSDFRKNASRMASALHTCHEGLVGLLDLRFPLAFSKRQAMLAFQTITGPAQERTGNRDLDEHLAGFLGTVALSDRRHLSDQLALVEAEIRRTHYSFNFSDCSIGNLVFAGLYLHEGRDFNSTIDAYCALLGLPAGLIENVTDGANACLVAIDRYNKVLGSEADIVDASKRNYIKDLFLIDSPPTPEVLHTLKQESLDRIVAYLEQREKPLRMNPRLLGRLAEADLIMYAPGTQHSSLFPSYMTPGLGRAIAGNYHAMKVLITNLQEDAEIPENSALDIIERAVYFLKEKGDQRIPTPFLVTHYLLNDPAEPESRKVYVPLGRLQTLEDPRLIRVGNYEDGVTGHHDAQKILTPFIEAFLKKGEPRRVGVLLLDTDSMNKISQTVLEALRGGLSDLQARVTFFYRSEETFGQVFADVKEFTIHNVWIPGEPEEESFLRAVRFQSFEYVLLFESSGMYKGEDIVNLIALLSVGDLDGVWGSRRLSVKDIHESYKFRYHENILFGALSYLGSHCFSLAYLLLYGRYISDTLSGVRAIRTKYFNAKSINLKDKRLNHWLLSMTLRDQGTIFETPVQFVPISPDKVKRTSAWDGMRSVLTIFRARFGKLEQVSGTEGRDQQGEGAGGEAGR